MGVEGSVAVVTGVTSGLGRGIATAFVRRGAHVVGCGRRSGLGAELADELRGLPGSFDFVTTDVTRVADCRKLIDSALEKWGRVDVLINNAGFEGDPPSIDSHEVSEEHWDAVVDTNYKGAFFCTRYALPAMKAQGGGVVLNIASLNAIEGPARMAAYSSSKAALVQLSRTLAVEYLRDDIRVNAIIMGGVDTPQAARCQDSYARHLRGPDYVRPEHEADELLSQDPEEIGGVLANLASGEMRLVTGATIAIDRAATAGLLASTMIYMTAAGLWSPPE